ncbi:MAG: tetratricopeptide repeat protein [Bryobacterales bacterium]|nr:tetratricopeptide repeat protein [Bryobacterales bacterium]
MTAARIALMFAFYGLAHGQFLPAMQAEDPAEFDAYIAVLKATGKADAAARFEAAWPKSGLLPHVYEMVFEEKRGKGDVAGAIREGRRALEAAPGNVTVAVSLAGIYATQGQLKEAEKLVGDAEEMLRQFRVPRSVPPAEWEPRSAKIRARSAAVRGLVAFKRDRVEEAIARFEEAIRLAAEPSDHLRLGRLYQLQGRVEEARKQFALAGEKP